MVSFLKKKAFWAFVITPLFSSYFLFFSNLSPDNPLIAKTLGIALLMAVWWISEAVPLAITALIPVAFFPLLGIMNGKDVSSTYFNHVIFLFIGGFLLALAMEKWNLHKRIALKILLWIGGSPARILFGFMLATAFLSMWISNTATAMMMVPIALSLLIKLEESLSKADAKNYSVALLLGVAYSASIGGMATLVGSPPNLSFARIFSIIFPEAPEIGFSDWLLFAFPLSLSLFLFTFGWLFFLYRPKEQKSTFSRDIFKNEYLALGKASFEEKSIFVLFTSMAFLWISRTGFVFGAFEIKGWESLFPYPEYINDGTVAIFISLFLFILPSKSKKGERILDQHIISKLPWSIVLLFGGGFALASGFTNSGLSLWIGEQVHWLHNFHPIVILFTVTLIVSFLTEMTSNTATTEMMLPILAGIAISIEINPLILMLPATFAASLAFMLPVATPPNAIIFGTNRIRVGQMVKTGFVLNFFAVILVTLFVYFYGKYMFDIDLNVFPEWAILKTK
ncbi:MAG TPA: sodium:dicarboxylate symporter [Bacteroidales bacterium]|nr:sodium:dicarboxylate symporter [Bacteroidales bacterium]